MLDHGIDEFIGNLTNTTINLDIKSVKKLLNEQYLNVTLLKESFMKLYYNKLYKLNIDDKASLFHALYLQWNRFFDDFKKRYVFK